MISAIPTSPLLHQVLSLASGMAAINLIPGLIRLLPRAVSRCPPAVTQSLTYRECVITSAGVVALKERPDHVSLGRPGGASGATTPKSASAARGWVGVGAPGLSARRSSPPRIYGFGAGVRVLRGGVLFRTVGAGELLALFFAFPYRSNCSQLRGKKTRSASARFKITRWRLDGSRNYLLVYTFPPLRSMIAGFRARVTNDLTPFRCFSGRSSSVTLPERA